MTGSKYIWIVMAQLADGIIGPEDLQLFNEDTQKYILSMTKFFTEE